jgi:hypothetical protein
MPHNASSFRVSRTATRRNGKAKRLAKLASKMARCPAKLEHALR